jgi:hypothetical protein
MGLTAVPHEFGYFRTIEASPQWGFVTVTNLAANGVPRLLRDIREFFGDAAVSIDVEDDAYSGEIGAAFVDAGWTDRHATVFLAHMGEKYDAAPRIDVERVDDATIDDFSRAKLMGFADSEDEPEVEQIRQESAVRLAEMGGPGHCLLTRVDGEPASICAYYDGDDWLVFLLATRVPFRHRRLARSLLHHVLHEGRDARSVMINAQEGGRPEALYRSLGFTDVVHRRWTFRTPS